MNADLSTAAVVCGATLALLAIGISFGLWIGLQIAAAGASKKMLDLIDKEDRERSRLMRMLDRCIESGRLAVNQSETVADMVARQRPTVAALTSAVRELVATSNRVATHLKDARHATEASAGNDEPCHDSKPLPEELGDGEAILEGKRRPGTANKRYAYDCYQHLTRGDEFEPLTPDKLRPVRCHDIGVDGISFFWPEEPDFERLVISIGAREQTLFMVCEVQDSKAVYMHGQLLHLVDCRFVTRLKSCRLEPNQRELVMAGV